MNENLVSGIVVAFLLALGLLFLTSAFTTKIAVVTVALIAATLCGLFAPTFGQQLLGVSTYVGLAVVGIVWLFWTVIKSKDRLRFKQPTPRDKNKPGTKSSSESAVVFESVDHDSAEGKANGDADGEASMGGDDNV